MEINSYKEVKLKEPDKKKGPEPMKEWSILSNYVRNVTHGRSEAFQKLSIDSMNYRQDRDLYKKLNNGQTIRISLNFGRNLENLKDDYLDVYEGMYMEVISTDKFDDMHETVTFYPAQMLGIIDLRSLGYYKIKQGVLQQNLSHMYHFEFAHEVCNQFNRLINTLRKEERMEVTAKYPWLDNTDERKYMSDKEILEKYIDLENSCLTKEEKREVRSLIYE